MEEGGQDIFVVIEQIYWIGQGLFDVGYFIGVDVWRGDYIFC